MKKFVLLFSLFSFLFSLSEAYAYTQTDINNASFLADQGIIVKQSTTAGYRLDSTITRAELVGIALKIRGIQLPSYQCKGYFSDVRNNDWICRAVELAADSSLVTRANATFRPNDKITRAESLAILMNASGEYEVVPVGGPHFVDTNTWQYTLMLKTIVYFPKILNNVYTDVAPGCEMEPCIRYHFEPNRPATRAEVFEFVRNILEKKESRIPDVISFNSSIVEDIEKGSEGYDITLIDAYDAYWGESMKVRVRFNYGKKLADFISDYSGFDVGVEKVQENTWFTDSCDIGGDYSYTFYTNDYSFEIPGCAFSGAEAVKNLQLQFVNQQTLKTSDVLEVYYKFLDSQRNIGGAYSMRSPTGVSSETFHSWYKNVTSVVFREDTLKSLGNNTYEFLVDMTESGVKSTYKVTSKVDLENFKINNLSSVKQ